MSDSTDLRAQSHTHWDASHRCIAWLLTLLPGWLPIQGFRQCPLPRHIHLRFDILLEQLPELRKILHLGLPVHYRGYNSGKTKWNICIGQGIEGGGSELPCPLQVCHLLSTSVCSSTWKLLESLCSKVFITQSLAPPPLPGGWGRTGTNFSPSNHLFAFLMTSLHPEAICWHQSEASH